MLLACCGQAWPGSSPNPQTRARSPTPFCPQPAKPEPIGASAAQPRHDSARAQALTTDTRYLRQLDSLRKQTTGRPRRAAAGAVEPERHQPPPASAS